MELIDKAKNYVAQKAEEMLTAAIERAYMDGYRDGYKDRGDEIPIILSDGSAEYVDLGLPSGTLWSTDYVKEKENILYLPYCEAKKYSIPTKEQWEELYKSCYWDYKADEGIFLGKGPNGKIISFTPSGYYKIDNNTVFSDYAYFWIHKIELQNNKVRMAICLDYEKIRCVDSISYSLMISPYPEIHMGFSLPIRLVR